MGAVPLATTATNRRAAAPIAPAASSPSPSPRRRFLHRRPGTACSHCNGSGHEPLPFDDRSLERGAVSRIARESGVDKASISRMLAGQSVPSLATIVLASEAMGISESRLIRCPPVWHRLLGEIAADGDDE